MSPRRYGPALVVRRRATFRSRLSKDTWKEGVTQARSSDVERGAPVASWATEVRDVRIGLQIPDFNGAGGSRQLGGQLAAVAGLPTTPASTASALMDHFFQISHASARLSRTCSRPIRRSATWPPARPRARLLTLVTGARLPAPGILAKIGHDPGRAVAAAGPGSASARRGTRRSRAAWASPFPPLAERFERLEETLQICLQMWQRRRVAVPWPALPARASAQPPAR